MPIVETAALTAGTALVGDFSKAVQFDRQSLANTLGTINDQFIRNMVTVLGEIRVGFGVIRPSAFVKASWRNSKMHETAGPRALIPAASAPL